MLLSYFPVFYYFNLKGFIVLDTLETLAMNEWNS